MSVVEAPRKIALVGTSCVGKTTLLDQLKNTSHDPLTFFVREAARTFFSMYPWITNRFSAEIQGMVQALALQNEQTAHKAGARRIICDRSVIDAPAYVLAKGDPQGADQLFDNVAYWLCTYTRVFLLNPTDVEYQQDAIRQESESDRMLFHQAFLQLFTQKGVEYELLSGTPEQRREKVEYALQT